MASVSGPACEHSAMCVLAGGAMPGIQLSQGKLWYAARRVEGSPYPPLVLLHGAAGSHLHWPGELRRLPAATVLVPDLPGHGRSDGPGRQSVEAYAAVVLEFLDALGIRRAIIGGHSMGGAIAQMLALDSPRRVAGLILLGTGARLRVHPDILNHVLDDPPGVYDLLLKWMWAEGTPESTLRLGRQQMAANDPQTVHGDFIACNTFDVMGRVGEIAAPTLVIGGTADRMTPLKYSEYLADHIPAAEMVTVEGGGHMMALEQPQVVAQAVSSWLARTDFQG